MVAVRQTVQALKFKHGIRTKANGAAKHSKEINVQVQSSRTNTSINASKPKILLPRKPAGTPPLFHPDSTFTVVLTTFFRLDEKYQLLDVTFC